ncbi:hypothetical protein [Labilibaculum euxinus]|uniref:Uncharacterized protein n=1 Tax=Labilibaculum euxinus TaxID=2686357 RepID=A0A7M4D6G2_9BACT|nr:hypothetical protein [Labilibaculum euxinus]MUP38241.1 hypothetical protein [Labilibaculum euxinus]MVB07446.1 hypothetical protein [Labilibaculum euxinus]
MNDVYTLLNFARKNTGQEMISLMDRIANSDVFESIELVEYLDRFKVKSQSNFLHRVLGFRQSTKNVNLKLPDIAEIALN